DNPPGTQTRSNSSAASKPRATTPRAKSSLMTAAFIGTHFGRALALHAFGLWMHDDGHEGGIDLEAAVVFDEAKLLELVHKEVHARTRRPDHFSEGFLRDSRQHPTRFVLLAVACEQQQRAGQAFFARVEQLIHEVGLEAGVPHQHVCDES